MINLDELEAKARAATPGPWELDQTIVHDKVYSINGVKVIGDARVSTQHNHGVRSYTELVCTPHLGAKSTDDIEHIKNMEHIAAANPDTVLKLIAAMRVYREALRAQAKHNGYCDGPLGCGCSAPKAQEALAQADKILDGEVPSNPLDEIPDGEIYMTDAGPALVMIQAEAFQALRPGDRVGFKLGKIK